MNGDTIRNNECTGNACGGAIYVSAYEKNGAELTLTGGTITGNTSAGDGAGIYLHSIDNKSYAKLFISGSPSFGEGNFSTKAGLVQANDKNGGEAVYSSGVRQDIYLAETADTPYSLVVTGRFSNVAKGSIWVWAAKDKHYLTQKPFATKASGVNLQTSDYEVFRNAQPDLLTRCGGEEYLKGKPGTVSTDLQIYWDGGFDVTFLKVDGFNTTPVSGAVFTLKNADSTLTYTATSANGTSDKDTSGNLLDVGTVLFSAVPPGTYTLKETTAPSGYQLRSQSYTVVVGNDGKATVTLDDQELLHTSVGTTKQYRLLNYSAATLKVILKKVVSEDNAPLQGAKFDVLYWDGGVINNSLLNLTSSENGVFWIGNLSAGKYLLHETGYPDNTTHNSGDTEGTILGWWYTMTVSDSGEVNITAQRESKYPS